MEVIEPDANTSRATNCTHAAMGQTVRQAVKLHVDLVTAGAL